MIYCIKNNLIKIIIKNFLLLLTIISFFISFSFGATPELEGGPLLAQANNETVNRAPEENHQSREPLSYNGFKIDYSIYYNIFLDKTSDVPNVGGFTIGGNMTWMFQNVHEFGFSLFWTTYSTSDAEFSRPSFAWEARGGFTYKSNIRYWFFAFNYGVHTGPAYFNAQETPADGLDKSHVFFFIHPEIDFEFLFFNDNFAIAIPIGYVIHVGGVSGKSVDSSHMSVGLTWRWYRFKTI